MEGRNHYCDLCLQRQGQADRKFDCKTCEDHCPELIPENRAVWGLWTLISTQWRVSALGLVGLDYPAVFAVAEVFGMEMTPALFQKIKVLETEQIFRQREGD